MRLIGDVHGKYSRYKTIIASGPPGSIQVGDMGVGFRRTQGPRVGEFYSNPPHYAMLAGHHRFIRGNHDNPAECRKHSQWISDGAVEDGVMFIGGALSIDRHLRLEDYNWWPDEELSIKQLDDMITVYLAEKPRVMITHDCPREAGDAIYYGGRSWGSIERSSYDKLESRSEQAFQSMWSAHAPDLWVFGHWHHSFDHVLHGGRDKGTRFVCLAELEYRDDLL